MNALSPRDGDAREIDLGVEYEAERLRWQLAISAGGVGGFDWDLLTGRLVWDERLEDLFGYAPGSFPETIEAFNDRLHPDDLPRVGQALEECFATCGDFEAEYRVVHPDGATRWVRARGRTLGDEAGRAVRLLGAAYDTSDAHDAGARVARVLESMPAAFFLLDPQWRFAHVNARAERLLGASREELLGGVVWELFPAAVGADFETQYRRAVATGRPVSFEAYYPSPLDAWYEVRAWPAPDGLSVYFLDVTERRRAQQELVAAREEADAARRAAEEAVERLGLLVRVGEDLAGTLDVEVAVGRLAQHLVPALADWCLVSVVDEHGGLRDIASWHVDEVSRPLVEEYRGIRLAASRERSFLRQVLRTGEPAVVERDAAAALVGVLEPGRARELALRLAPESFGVLPLRARGRTVGLVSLFRGRSRAALAGQDLVTAGQVADRAGLALDNTRLYAQQHRVAESLQRSLLTEPVEPDHVQVAVRYLPAASSAQVGGDWYDAFLTPDGSTVLVIGDVMGHDIEAAAAMGQVRSLLRGIAYSSGASPAVVLSSLDATMQGLAVETTATALVARLERGPAEAGAGVVRLRWSSAGHPPPLLLAPDGEVSSLESRPAQLLLGVDPTSRRSDAVVVVERGSTVLLFTDGLVERRGTPLDEGLAALRDVVAELAGLDLESLCDEVLARTVPAGHDDDVAVVAVRLHPEEGPRPVEAGPRRVPPHPRTPVTPPVG